MVSFEIHSANRLFRWFPKEEVRVTNDWVQLFKRCTGTNLDPGVGNDAAKVVADCIHSSRVKEMGQSLLQKNTNVSEVDDDVLHSYDRLSEEDVKKLQLKLARSLVVFMELLHLLIARNRDLLLDVIQERKKSEPGSGGGAYHTYNRSLTREFVSAPPNEPPQRPFARKHSIASYDSVSSQDGRSRGGRGGDESVRSQSQHQQSQHLRSGSGASGGDEYGNGSTSSSGHNEKVRTDSAIAVQSELQRAFISLAKALHPMILGIMGTSETPRWLKLCCQENYFSAYTYRQAKIRKFESSSNQSVSIFACLDVYNVSNGIRLFPFYSDW